MSSGKDSETSDSIKRQYPDRPVASVAVCVLKGEKILVIKRAKPPSRGLWSVPGGVVELGETIEETACREIQEECGIQIEAGQVFNVENLIVRDEKGRVQFHYVVTYLIARYLSGEAQSGSDAAGVRWATASELKNLDMNPVVRKNMLRALEIGLS